MSIPSKNAAMKHFWKPEYYPSSCPSKTHVETGNIWDKLNNESRDTNKSAVSTKAIVQPP